MATGTQTCSLCSERSFAPPDHTPHTVLCLASTAVLLSGTGRGSSGERTRLACWRWRPRHRELWWFERIAARAPQFAREGACAPQIQPRHRAFSQPPDLLHKQRTLNTYRTLHMPAGPRVQKPAFREMALPDELLKPRIVPQLIPNWIKLQQPWSEAVRGRKKMLDQRKR
jgi:hypothetical protein